MKGECKNSGSQSEELRRDSGTLKFSNPVSSVKDNTLNDIKDRIAKEEGFKNWTELTWEVNYTSYELLWRKVANELVKENQELKALIEELENEIKVLQQFDER